LFLLVVLFLAALMGEYMAKVFSGESTRRRRCLSSEKRLTPAVDESRDKPEG
jgi:K+-transporting ATPase A subunit